MISLLTDSIATFASSGLLAAAVVTPTARKTPTDPAAGARRKDILTKPLPQGTHAAPPAAESKVVPLAPSARKRRSRSSAPLRQPSATQLVDLDETPESLPGLFGDLEMLFRQRLAIDPRNIDIRFKLLEIAYTVGNAEVFMTEHLILREQLSDPKDPRVATMLAWGKDLMPDHPLFRGDALEAGCSLGGTATRRESNRHYDSLSYRRAQPALEALRARYTAQWKHLEKAIHNMAKGFDSSRELGRWARKNAPAHGATIVVRHGNAGAFHPVSFNARAQVLIAGQLGYRHVVTAARSIEHALAVVRGVEDSAGKLSCEIFIDAQLAASHPDAARKLQSDQVIVHWPDTAAEANDAEADARVLALNKMLASSDSTYYVCDLGSGPAPYSGIIRDIQTVLGRAVQDQLNARRVRSKPDAIVTCAESGQSGISMLLSFLDHDATRMYCIEADEQAADGGAQEPIDMRARREHDWLRKANRVKYCAAPKLAGQRSVTSTPGHQEANRRALALAASIAAGMPAGATVLVQLASNGARKA